MKPKNTKNPKSSKIQIDPKLSKFIRSWFAMKTLHTNILSKVHMQVDKKKKQKEYEAKRYMALIRIYTKVKKWRRKYKSTIDIRLQDYCRKALSFWGATQHDNYVDKASAAVKAHLQIK